MLAWPDELVGGACTCSATHLPRGCWLAGAHSRQSPMSWAMRPPTPHTGIPASISLDSARWPSPKRR